MSTLEDVESAVLQLGGTDLQRFRQWFAQFDADHWDRQFDEDLRAGKLDHLADQAIEHYRLNRCKPL